MNAMLSRVADSLYWMSRYLERADHVARQFDVHLTIVPEQAVDAAQQRRNRLIACLVGGGLSGRRSRLGLRPGLLADL